MSDLKFCPYCGGERIKDEPVVWIEDGPYSGSRYANEGQFSRYSCVDCKGVFGEMPAPIFCAKCGKPVGGEVGEDCYEGEDEDTFICEECEEQGKPDE